MDCSPLLLNIRELLGSEFPTAWQNIEAEGISIV